MKTTTALALVFALAAPAHSIDKHISLKGFHLGMERDDVLKIDPFFCKRADIIGGCFTIGSALITDRFFKYDRDDHLRVLRFEYASADFEAIKAAIIGKYPATKCSTSPVQNRFGAQFTDFHCRYVSGDEAIIFEKYSETVVTGTLTLATREYIESLWKTWKQEKDDI